MSRIDSELLLEREHTHGDYEEQAELSQTIKRVLATGKNYKQLPPYQKDSLDMICVKISRVLSGDNNEKDHWADLSGYPMLVFKILENKNGYSGGTGEASKEETHR